MNLLAFSVRHHHRLFIMLLLVTMPTCSLAVCYQTDPINPQFIPQTGYGSPFVNVLLPILIGIGFSSVLWSTIRYNLKKTAHAEKQVQQAEAKVEQHPERVSPAWEVARRNLELYFQRNRAQVSQVFVIAIIVMTVGFAFVLFGVYLALQNRGITPTLVAGVSGVITQFIGATFMVIYRSTMTQANEFMAVLERINTVGMAVQVLDSIPDDDKQLKNQTRAEIVSLLLNANITAKTQPVKKARATTQ